MLAASRTACLLYNYVYFILLFIYIAVVYTVHICDVDGIKRRAAAEAAARSAATWLLRTVAAQRQRARVVGDHQRRRLQRTARLPRQSAQRQQVQSPLSLSLSLFLTHTHTHTQGPDLEVLGLFGQNGPHKFRARPSHFFYSGRQ